MKEVGSWRPRRLGYLIQLADCRFHLAMMDCSAEFHLRPEEPFEDQVKFVPMRFSPRFGVSRLCAKLCLHAPQAFRTSGEGMGVVGTCCLWCTNIYSTSQINWIVNRTYIKWELKFDALTTS